MRVAVYIPGLALFLGLHSVEDNVRIINNINLGMISGSQMMKSEKQSDTMRRAKLFIDEYLICY